MATTKEDIASIKATMEAMHGMQLRVHSENQEKFRKLFLTIEDHSRCITKLDTTVTNGLSAKVTLMLKMLDGYKEYKTLVKWAIPILGTMLLMLLLLHAQEVLKIIKF